MSLSYQTNKRRSWKIDSGSRKIFQAQILYNDKSKYLIFVNISQRSISRNILGTNFCSRQPPKKKLTTDNLGERQELDKVNFLDLYPALPCLWPRPRLQGRQKCLLNICINTEKAVLSIALAGCFFTLTHFSTENWEKLL